MTFAADTLKPPGALNLDDKLDIDKDGRTSEDAEDKDMDEEEAGSLRRSRTPRPYHYDEVEQWTARGEWEQDTGQISITPLSSSSESGTEADDERPSFIKALPPSTVRPRKGLKTGEQDEDALLTPSQLDEREKELSSYFGRVTADEKESAIAERSEWEEREKLLKRRFAEFVRRTSEVALMAVILGTVLCGEGVARCAWEWRRELLSYFLIVILLILVYPVKLSIVDQAATPTSIWQRFRVPASFDPATILYPPLLPVMVALSVAPAGSAVVLPNIILGLASLPQRLFPRSSRLGGLNAVHWLITIVPLVLSEHTAWPRKPHPPEPYLLKTLDGLSPETLVTLYPLHHALLLPLQYLTTTSLLISELHLLSVVLINVLLLAASPQTIILKACLWIGGVTLFVSCGRPLRWNVTLARIPRWKLRRSGHTAEERKSLVDAVSNLIHLQRAAAALNPATGNESDADEDLPTASIKPRAHGLLRTKTMDAVTRFSSQILGAKSTGEPQLSADDTPSSCKAPRPRRRNTVPEREPPKVRSRTNSTKRSRARSTNLLWCLQLTPQQASKRKWLYAGFTYLMIITIILIPVRSYVSRKALYGQEPIGWALGYLFGQIPVFCQTVSGYGLDWWIPLPRPTSLAWSNIPFTFPLNIDLIRTDLGPANIRILLIAYWILILLLGLLTVFSLTAFVEVDTRRKVFHGVMVAMFLPSAFIDPCFCSLAVALVLAIFLLLEVLRAGQVPPLGSAISRFVAPYVDGRDLRGPVVVSHIFLLIGCAVPLWFSLASFERSETRPSQEWELKDNLRETAMLAGVVCVGMGDAAASLIGRRYGRRKWIWVGGKSLEGSAAFAGAVTIGLLGVRAWLEIGGWEHPYTAAGSSSSSSGLKGGIFSDRLGMANWTLVDFVLKWGVVVLKAGFCGCGTSFMEAVLTGANDNVVVPVALWLLVRGVRL